MNAVAFHEFDFSKRHCWGPNKNGEFTVDGKFDTKCIDWKKHVIRADNTQFIRWIREFGILVPGIVTGFDDGWLKLGKDFCTTYKQDIYCENYGGKVKAFLDIENETAIVEIYDETLLEAAEQATLLVEKQYEDMLNVGSNPA